MKWYHQIIQDTLKEKQPDGSFKWSRTSLTMASAWFCVVFAFFYDLIANGFNELTFAEMLGVAVGVRWVASKSQLNVPKT